MGGSSNFTKVVRPRTPVRQAPRPRTPVRRRSVSEDSQAVPWRDAGTTAEQNRGSRGIRKSERSTSRSVRNRNQNRWPRETENWRGSSDRSHGAKTRFARAESPASGQEDEAAPWRSGATSNLAKGMKWQKG